MLSKKIFFGLIALLSMLVFMGCPDPNNNENYDGTGTWLFSIDGQTATVTVTGSEWIFDGPGTAYDDTGIYSQTGNLGILYSNAWEANIGTATITSNTTMVLTLHSPSLITGTFNATKQ